MRAYSSREHFKMIYGWWKYHRGASLDLESLPELGLVAYDGGVPIASSWLYLTNSKVANLGWMVTNPKARPRQSKEAAQAIIQGLMKMAKDAGATRIWTFSSSRGLTKLFYRAGLVPLENHDFLVGVP